MDFRQSKLLLRFLDPGLEGKYRKYKDDLLVKPLREGIIQSFFLWIPGMILLFFIQEGQLREIALIETAIIFPVFIAILVLSRKGYLKGIYHEVAAISNLIPALLIFYLGFNLENSAYPLFIGIFFILFFGLYSYRFRILTTAFLVTTYMAIFLVWNFLFADAEGSSHAILVYYSLGIIFFALITSFQAEKKDRETFVLQVMLEKEQEKSEHLLMNILPPEIAERLKAGETNIAESQPKITVLFADLVGFTTLSERMSAEDLVKLLNHIFSAFDKEALAMGLEKIKTIGDAYMVVGGRNTPDSGARQIAGFALKILNFIQNDPMVREKGIEIRIGFHTGKAVAGVIGLTKFSFDLWGDTVNTASRMESHGEPGRIHLSREARDELGDDFQFEAREPILVKGKGRMETFFLNRTVS